MRPGLYGDRLNRARKPFAAFPKKYYHISELIPTEYDWESKVDDGYVKLGPMELISWGGEDGCE